LNECPEEIVVADQIRRIDYYYLTVSDKPGEGARVLAILQAAGVNLIGISAFPHGAHKSQVDLIPEDSGAFRKAAKTAGFKLSRKKTGFLIQGEDRPGAVADAAGRLAKAHINIVSTQVFCAGSGRYGGMLWVGAPDLRKAAKALGATSVQTPKLVSKPAGYPSPFDENP
jgi:hypothetical protein